MPATMLQIAADQEFNGLLVWAQRIERWNDPVTVLNSGVALLQSLDAGLRRDERMMEYLSPAVSPKARLAQAIEDRVTGRTARDRTAEYNHTMSRSLDMSELFRKIGRKTVNSLYDLTGDVCEITIDDIVKLGNLIGRCKCYEQRDFEEQAHRIVRASNATPNQSYQIGFPIAVRNAPNSRRQNIGLAMMRPHLVQQAMDDRHTFGIDMAIIGAVHENLLPFTRTQEKQASNFHAGLRKLSHIRPVYRIMLKLGSKPDRQSIAHIAEKQHRLKHSMARARRTNFATSPE